MNSRDRSQWVRGPKPRKKQIQGWQETEALMKAKKLNPYFNTAETPLGKRIMPGSPIDKPLEANKFISPPAGGSALPNLPDKSKAIDMSVYKKNKSHSKDYREEYEDKPKKESPVFTSTPVIRPSFQMLNSDTEEDRERYFQEKMMEKIKSGASPKYSFEFEYYEGELIQPEEEEEAEFLETPVSNQLESRIRKYLKEMIAYSPSAYLSELMMAELELLGEILVGECQEFGIGIIIFEKYRNLTEIKIDNQLPFPPGSKVRDGRGWEMVRGAYNPQHRMMFMAEELVMGKPGGVSTHEFAHAYDHAWQINNEMKFGFSVFLWNQFYNERTFITEYAATQPKEYFAVSLESYFNPHRKELLKKCDPRMYGFITNLIAGVHKKPSRKISE